MERMSFTAQFKIELLLPFTGCRKVLGKMPARHLLEKRSLLANYLHKSILHLGKTINFSLFLIHKSIVHTSEVIGLLLKACIFHLQIFSHFCLI